MPAKFGERSFERGEANLAEVELLDEGELPSDLEGIKVSRRETSRVLLGEGACGDEETISGREGD